MIDITVRPTPALDIATGLPGERGPIGPAGPPGTWPWLNVRDFGAVGDGSRDDTVAIQTALDQVAVVSGTLVFPPGLYLVSDHLWVGGETSLAGQPGAEIRLAAPPTYGSQWVSFGGTGYGQPANRWTGTVQNITWSVAATAATGDHLRMFNITNAVGATVADCTFDVTAAGTAPIGPIIGGTNVNFVPGPVTRQNIQIVHNRCVAAQDDQGSEGMSLGFARGCLFSGNYVFGFGDDAIAGHNCADVAIIGNHCYSIDGRILSDACSQIRITGNYLERIASPANGQRYTAMGAIMVSGNVTGQGSAVTADFAVVGNVLRCWNDPAGGVSDAGILLAGGSRRGTVTGNTVTNMAGGPVPTVAWGSRTQAGWVDPEGAGLDPAGQPGTRDVRIAGNSPVYWGPAVAVNTVAGAASSFNVAHDATGPVDPVAVNGQTITNWNGVINAGHSHHFVINLTATRTAATTITNGYIGQEITVTFAQDATGGWTCPWPNNCTLASPAAVNTGPGARTTVRLRCEQTTPGTLWWFETGRAA